MAVSGLAVLGLAATTAPAAAASRPVSTFTGADTLWSVAVASATNAFAVGNYFVGSSTQMPLIEQWNGHSWRIAKGASVGPAGGSLLGVAALSAKNAWAVGERPGGALIEHWNGVKWSMVKAAPVQVKGAHTSLAAVAAVSAKSVYAVGQVSTPHGLKPLIEHWTGHSWSMMPSPDPGGLAANAYLTGVAASKSGAWAVGVSAPGNVYRTVVLALVHGKWHQPTSPNPSGLGNWLGAASADGSRVLAAGFGGYDNPVAARTLVMHRSGPAFKLDVTPDPGKAGSADELYGVAATTSGGWAVGRQVAQTMILGERSGHWHAFASPSWPSPDTSILLGVGAKGSAAWAVGDHTAIIGSTSVTYSLALHWTGSKWVTVPTPNR